MLLFVLVILLSPLWAPLCNRGPLARPMYAIRNEILRVGDISFGVPLYGVQFLRTSRSGPSSNTPEDNLHISYARTVRYVRRRETGRLGDRSSTLIVNTGLPSPGLSSEPRRNTDRLAKF